MSEAGNTSLQTHFARSYIRIGTIAAIFICGPMIDLVSSFLSPYLSGQEA